MKEDPNLRSESGIAPIVVRVLPNEPGLNKTFDYLLPSVFTKAASLSAPALDTGSSVGFTQDSPAATTQAAATQTANTQFVDGAGLVQLGTIVRFALHGRRVGGWIVGVNVESTIDRSKLKPLAKISGLGPSEELLSLAKWASWRWWGKPAHFLRTASPDHVIRGLPAVKALDPALLSVSAVTDDVVELAKAALDPSFRPGPVVVRVPPGFDTFSLLVEAARFAGRSGVLIVAASISSAVHIARRFRRAGAPVALLPGDWARAAAGGCVVVGARSAAWAPIPAPGLIVVLDEHDEAHKQEQTPAWNARDVAIERARRLEIPILLTSPIPSLESLSLPNVRVVEPSRAAERRGWPRVDVIDRAEEDPGRQGIISDRLVSLLRSNQRLVLVLNRIGRAKLLACHSCGALCRCEHCESAMKMMTESSVLVCQRCSRERPVLCASCGGATLKNVRVGVTRAREEIEALALRPVAELTASSPEPTDGIRVVVGTEAALHRVGAADAVIFLDFDGELLAPRFRAAEQAMHLLVLAARLTGGKGEAGRIIVQTRQPDHEVLKAAILGDPSRVLEGQRELRSLLGFAPSKAVAAVSGAGADVIVEAIRALEVAIQIDGPPGGPFLLRAPSQSMLCSVLSKVERPDLRVRVEIDPLRL
jgi:primosomal protein N' (replication factor Y) (superfamily II helicase)